jgi:hypothetical protein
MTELTEVLRIRVAPDDEARLARLAGDCGAVGTAARAAIRAGLDVLERRERERWSGESNTLHEESVREAA